MRKQIINLPSRQNFVILGCIIFAGEIIFSLPFHIPRFFRPTLLEVFEINNTQLGDVIAIYGITAMLAYFPGGAIADHFSYRKLMAASLAATALGGLYLAQIPTLIGLFVVFAFWGVTTVLLFWAAMIKATRDWAGSNSQGLAFGLLDGGRGLVASLAATLAVLLLGASMTETDIEAPMKQSALENVILFYSACTAIAATLCWFLLPEKSTNAQSKFTAIQHDIGSVLTDKRVWLQGGIVITAYCGFKGADNYGLYASQVLGMSDVDSSAFTTGASYIRPIAALLAGLLADKWHASRLIRLLFIGLIGFYFLLFLSSPPTVHTTIICINLLVTFAAVFALRGVYFTLLEESKIRLGVTGTAVGVISVIGYTPDIFFASISGRILDANPGIEGFQNYFLMLAGIAIAGLLFSHWLIRMIYPQQGPVTQPYSF